MNWPGGAIKLIFLLLVSGMLSAQTVYKTPSGKKYHTANCHTVKNTSSALPVAEARDIGLEPCKICKPGTTILVVSKLKDETSGEKASSSQCKGQTKKNTRCKHMTKIGNGYCFQHQAQQ